MGTSSDEDDFDPEKELDHLNELQRAYLEKDATELLRHFPAESGQQVELVRLGQELLKRYKNLYEKAKVAPRVQAVCRRWLAKGDCESKLVDLMLGAALRPLPGTQPPSGRGRAAGAAGAGAVLEARSLLGRVDARLRRARLDFPAAFRCADEKYSKSVSLDAFAAQLFKLRALQETEVDEFKQLLGDSMEVPYDRARLLAVSSRPLLPPGSGGPEEQRAAKEALLSVRDALRELKKSRTELSSWEEVLRRARGEAAAARGSAPGGAEPAVCSALIAWLLQAKLPGVPPVVAHAAVLRAAIPCCREGKVTLNEERVEKTSFEPPLPAPPVFVHLSSTGLQAELTEALDGGLTLRLQAKTTDRTDAAQVRLRCHPHHEAPRYEAGALGADAGAPAEGGADSGAGGSALGLTVEVADVVGAGSKGLEKEVHFVPRLARAPSFVWAETLARPQAFAVGDRVEARYVTGLWRTATVIEILEDGKYLLDWDDKDTQERVKYSSKMRKKAATVDAVRASGFDARGPAGAYAYQAYAEHAVTAEALEKLAGPL